MTPPERLQDVTLAERLVAMAAEMDGMGESDVGDLLREAAAALSVRGDDGMELIESSWLDHLTRFIGPGAMAYLSREHEAHRARRRHPTLGGLIDGQGIAATPPHSGIPRQG